MSFAAKILADSFSPDCVRLTTFEITFPRIILAELNTHRMLSKNSASSRAIPVEKMIRMVQENPYVPSSWGKNQKGMQAGDVLSEDVSLVCQSDWLLARDNAVASARSLLGSGVHKQLTNRLLEPFMWHTVIVTATEWSNFFHLRNNPMAHPDMQRIASMMQALYEKNVPKRVYGWHLPLIDEGEISDSLPDARGVPIACKVSVGRCARVSYLTHDGKRDIEADIRLHDELLQNGHMSPFEHIARPARALDTSFARYSGSDTRYEQGVHGLIPPERQWHGNFLGWVQYRKLISGEDDILGFKR